VGQRAGAGGEVGVASLIARVAAYAVAGAWRAVRDMDAAWEKNSGTWPRRDEKSRLTSGPHQKQF
jgi:hypothetical protein